ncbi:unnamed protein product [Bursaphelenchus xylophilus]|uniref:(pine wood nematode) hypothetical protein n=1 Tax=Bursaphelenchus xylophilus TaxID=6326 RepID=A0A7I8XCI4_BURXY|nr:unnamed protein product [Bursaphelenchus xylophilus]CAG9131392.1 unnamed protein product [Bursaphelenchus xylophilus]
MFPPQKAKTRGEESSNLDHHLENDMNSNPDAARWLHSFHKDSQKHLTRLFIELMSKYERRRPPQPRSFDMSTSCKSTDNRKVSSSKNLEE